MNFCPTSGCGGGTGSWTAWAEGTRFEAKTIAAQAIHAMIVRLLTCGNRFIRN